jgi:hypothetical protein
MPWWRGPQEHQRRGRLLIDLGGLRASLWMKVASGMDWPVPRGIRARRNCGALSDDNRDEFFELNDWIVYI